MPQETLSGMTDGAPALAADRFEISRETSPGVWETLYVDAAAIGAFASALLTAGASAGYNSFAEIEALLLAASRLDLKASTVIRDDFLVASTETGEIGELGWSFTNGTWNLINAVEHHPGIARRTSTAVAGTVASVYPGGGGTAVNIRLDQHDEEHWSIRPVTTDADYDVRIGLFSDLTANPPTNGVYFERLAADASWYGVTRAGGVQTRSAALAAFAADWIRIRIRRIDAATIGFRVGDGAEVTQTTDIAAGTTALVFGAQIIPTSTNARSVDFDAFSARLTAQAR